MYFYLVLGRDYTHSNPASMTSSVDLEFSEITTTISVPIMILEDSILEGDETITISIMNVTMPFSISEGELVITVGDIDDGKSCNSM